MAEPDRHTKPTKTIRQLREARGWTQAVLAGRLRVARATVVNWERGRTMPNRSHRQAVAELFGVSVAELVAAQTEQVPHNAPQSRHTAGAGKTRRRGHSREA
jgi:transcriptional regulator with XRE-family HTH domain